MYINYSLIAEVKFLKNTTVNNITVVEIRVTREIGELQLLIRLIMLKFPLLSLDTTSVQ
jgi:hypothetical protein